MTAIIFSITFLCIIVTVVVFVFRPYDYGASLTHFKKIGSNIDKPASLADTRWRSIKIRPGLMSCERVDDMAGQVFLSGEAPELPLANCSERNCTCHYVFLDDRRSGTDRRTDLERLGAFLSQSERDRRRSPGRRTGDLALA